MAELRGTQYLGEIAFINLLPVDGESSWVRVDSILCCYDLNERERQIHNTSYPTLVRLNHDDVQLFSDYSADELMARITEVISHG